MRSLFLCLLLPACWTLRAQPSLFATLAARPDTVTLELATDWHELWRGKQRKEYQPATLRIDSLGSFRARVRTRGHVRLRQCENPSLRIKIPKAELRRLGYAELNHLKLVLPCYDRDNGRAYLRREKLVYDLYETLSPYHLRTITVRLRSPDGMQDRIAFLVEDGRETAARYDARLAEPGRLSSRGLERGNYLRTCLFNYLILNTDWYVYNRHNLLCINPAETMDLIVIPYDFDYSGFVGTSYAVPHESTGQRTIFDPVFRGRFVSEEELEAAAAEFLEREPDIRQFLADYPGLTDRHRRHLRQYLDDFFARIGSERGRRQLLSEQERKRER